MTEFFTENFRTDGYNSALSSAFQGQLASSYTNALANELKTNGADWIGFLAHTVNGLSVDDAIAVKTAVAAGQFSLDGLFGAAQSKTGAVDGASITDPQPILTVTIGTQVITIDLKAILSDLDTETWTQVDTTGGGKKATTVTTYHTREFYTDSGEPANYDSHWSDPPPVNEAPTLSASAPTNALVEAGETLGHTSIAGVFTSTVQLTASDPDGDATTFNLAGWTDTGGGVFTKAGTYGTASLDTATGIVAYTLEPSVDLHHDVVEHDSFSLSVNDGELNSNTVTIEFTINGSGDWYEGGDSTTVTKGPSNTTGDTFAGTFDLNDGVIANLSATLEALGDFDRNNESVGVTGDVVLGPLSGPTSTGPNPQDLDYPLGPATATIGASAIADGDVDYTIHISNNVAQGSTATLSIQYDYWI